MSGSGPPLDPAYLSDIFEAGGAELAREVAGTFLTDAPQRLQAVQEGVRAGDWPRAGQAAHAMVSGASMLGLRAVAEAARRIEHAAGAKQPPSADDVQALAAAVADAGNLLMRAIEDLARQGGQTP